MPWYAYVVHFIAGALLANGVPHFVNGIAGRPFPSPFARPPGVGESSPRVNVIWGFANFAVGYVLLTLWVAAPRPDGDLAVTFAGGLLAAVMLAQHFGRVRGDS
ncbi:MAG TPA: hypothetical protein VHD15_05050 [Hyphomicrobiales bacterium]|nr:hypothetical protein [Hyphomicrobiales bacterium]